MWSVWLTVGFVLLYLQAGRPWLAWAAFCGMRTFTLLPNCLVGQNLNYSKITALRHIRFLGESVSVAEGVPGPWLLVGQLSVAVLLFCFRGCKHYRLAAARPAQGADGRGESRSFSYCSDWPRAY